MAVVPAIEGHAVPVDEGRRTLDADPGRGHGERVVIEDHPGAAFADTAGTIIEGLRTSLPATRGRVGDKTFYSFLISPHDLLRIAYISHKGRTSNDDLETYQRMVKPARLKSIGAFIDDDDDGREHIHRQRALLEDRQAGARVKPGLDGAA